MPIRIGRTINRTAIGRIAKTETVLIRKAKARILTRAEMIGITIVADRTDTTKRDTRTIPETTTRMIAETGIPTDLGGTPDGTVQTITIQDGTIREMVPGGMTTRTIARTRTVIRMIPAVKTLTRTREIIPKTMAINETMEIRAQDTADTRMATKVAIADNEVPATNDRFAMGKPL